MPEPLVAWIQDPPLAAKHLGLYATISGGFRRLLALAFDHN